MSSGNSASNTGSASRPGDSDTPISDTPTVTLPGTAEDWIPKEWVIQALGNLGYMALLRDARYVAATVLTLLSKPERM
jgi:hypothetical protein